MNDPCILTDSNDPELLHLQKKTLKWHFQRCQTESAANRNSTAEEPAELQLGIGMPRVKENHIYSILKQHLHGDPQTADQKGGDNVC